jgi:hypothetical protein
MRFDVSLLSSPCDPVVATLTVAHLSGYTRAPACREIGIPVRYGAWVPRGTVIASAKAQNAASEKRS